MNVCAPKGQESLAQGLPWGNFLFEDCPEGAFGEIVANDLVLWVGI